MSKEIKVSLPDDLHKEIEKKIKDTSFDSMSDYVVFLLQQVIEVDKSGSDSIYEAKEEEEIKRKLQELGYI